ncbi:hypothetical protein LOD99_12322 [Oopsacas minuta]|uniref:E2F-associated phosphoprotein n=1 Tax=Oopsacas minuta TaxID=111878 RepID=A0AAV7JEZ3_9METZ|nr:hypothetical protein LOD99_12322 [Oopsacas minuta]
MEKRLDRFVSLDSSHNAGYFEMNDSDLELSEGDMAGDLGAYSSGEESNLAKELKIKSDQFEIDMDKELSDMIGEMGYPTYLLNHLNGIENSEIDPPKEISEKDPDLGFYDNVYFDSDTEVGEDMDEFSGDPKKRVLTNDELFYDPKADDLDEEWVNTQRMAYRNIEIPKNMNNSEEDSAKNIPKSDAILSCPGCMVTLCIDCQQHDLYKDQFRAMFVMHCRIEEGEILKYKKKKQKKKFKRREEMGSTEAVEYDVYQPVKCGSCQTEVGVFDEDEVYHFYNVLPSEP